MLVGSVYIQSRGMFYTSNEQFETPLVRNLTLSSLIVRTLAYIRIIESPQLVPILDPKLRTRIDAFKAQSDMEDKAYSCNTKYG